MKLYVFIFTSLWITRLHVFSLKSNHTLQYVENIYYALSIWGYRLADAKCACFYNDKKIFNNNFFDSFMKPLTTFWMVDLLRSLQVHISYRFTFALDTLLLRSECWCHTHTHLGIVYHFSFSIPKFQAYSNLSNNQCPPWKKHETQVLILRLY